MKVGIIGCGISGLYAAYHLQSKGYDCVIFEESAFGGGRFDHAIKILNKEFYPRFYDLIEKLNLEESLVPFGGIGVLTPEGVVDFPGFKASYDKFSPEDKKIYDEMEKEALAGGFDPFHPEERMLQLRNVSVEDHIKDCSEHFKESVIFPLISLTFMSPLDPSRISAEYLFFKFRLVSEFLKPEVEMFSKDEGLKVVTSVLERRLMEKGGEVSLFSTVKGVKEEEGKKVISFWKAGSEKKEEVDAVIFTTPLNRLREMDVDIDTGEGINYYETKYYSVKGEPITEKSTVLSETGNIKVFYDVYEEEQQIFPHDPEKETDFSLLYKENPVVIDETRVKSPFTVMAPGTRAPNIRQRKGVYICGDFYYYPYIENSLLTTEKAIEFLREDHEKE